MRLAIPDLMKHDRVARMHLHDAAGSRRGTTSFAFGLWPSTLTVKVCAPLFEPPKPALPSSSNAPSGAKTHPKPRSIPTT